MHAPSLLRLFFCAASLTLPVACSRQDAKAPAPVPAATPVIAAVMEPGFCAAMTVIASAEPTGFASLHGSPQGRDRWSGATVPPGFDSCTVVGAGRGRAQYVCVGQSASDRNGLPALDAIFEGVARGIDACRGQGLATSSVSSPQARLMRFAGGERLAVWRNAGPSPVAGLTLRLEEDFGSGAYTVSLTTATLR